MVPNLNKHAALTGRNDGTRGSKHHHHLPCDVSRDETHNIGEIKSTSSAPRWEECQQFDNFIYISCRGVNNSAFVSRIQNLSEATESILKILHFRDSFPVNILSLIKKQEIVAEDLFLISQ